MKKRIVIVGAGFGGIEAAKKLKNSDHEVVLIDKMNHHLFQPLLYQVATAALSPGDIAYPIRAIFSKQKNVKVIKGEVVDINRDEKRVILEDRSFDYDFLILAPGGRHHYFGNQEWEKIAPGLKTISDALTIREKILESFERAEMSASEEERKKYLTFVITGGGPTGVEMAGAIAEISKQTMIKDFKNIKPDETRIILIEGLPQVLSAYDDKLSEKAKKDLEALGVEVMVDTFVTGVEKDGVLIGEEKEKIESGNIIWGAGNRASPLLKKLDTELNKPGQAVVRENLTIQDDDCVFVIGDAVYMEDKKGDPLPGVCQTAMQQGEYVAKNLKKEIDATKWKPFNYNDKGIMATIGKAKAVAEIGKIKLSGFWAWVLWSLVHVFFLVTYRNRFRVMAEWFWYYLTNSHGTRLITGLASSARKTQAALSHEEKELASKKQQAEDAVAHEFQEHH